MSEGLFLPFHEAFHETASDLPQYLRLFRAFQQSILNGELAPGAKLPASRPLCDQLNISRNTVKTAYEMLIAEGYAESRHGAGTFVAVRLPKGLSDAAQKDANEPNVAPKLSQLARTLTQVRKPNRWEPGALLLPAQPCLASFPWNHWQRAISVAGRQMKFEANAVLGNLRLRQEIAKYLGATRGVKCSAEQVMICSGSQQAMFIALRLLVDDGEPVFAEEPCYQGIDGAIAAACGEKVPVPVDEQGIPLDLALERAANARVAMVTPSRNHPLGYTLSLERRLAWLQWAKSTGSWLIEDDYDSEFRFEHAPLTSLQGLGGEDVVIYTGTFSRILHPSIRLGYMVVPEMLVEAAGRAKTYMEGGNSVLPQLALAEFMENGQFASHVRRMRKLYQQRRDLLHGLIEREIGEQVTLVPSDGGMHSTYLLPDGWKDYEVRALCEAKGLGIRDLSRYFATSKPMHGIVAGFAGYDDRQITEGVQRLAKVIRGYAVVGWS